MSKYSKFNIVYRLQKWMDSVPGQTFLNYAYSWGASVVILGTLFKLTHLPGANFFLFLGMGTEVFVFFISAFDRPFDKTTDGMELDNHIQESRSHEEDVETFDVVDDEQVENARQRMTMHEGYPQNRRGEMVNTILSQTQAKMVQAHELSEKLPDNEDTAELKKTLNAIHEIYKLQLAKAGSQMTTVDDIDRQLKELANNLGELNKVYARMIAAVRQ